jgi:hypothetical protein
MSATTPPLPSRLRWREQRTRGALLLGMIRVERRTNGEASSVMQGAQMELAVEGLLNGSE